MYSLPLDDEVEFEVGEPVHICVYAINNNAMLPFLEYFLHKTDGELQFPKTLYTSQEHCDSIVSEIFRAFGKDKEERLFIFNGVFTDFKTREKYLFYNCSEYKIDCVNMLLKNDIWISLMDEIVNTSHVCSIPIAFSTSMFFLNNTPFIHLMDTEDSIGIELPVAAYVHCDSNLDFISTFGPQAIGGYYTFYSKMDEERRGVRFALFTGNTFIFENEGDALPDNYDSGLYVDDDEVSTWIVSNHSRQHSLCTF